MLRQSAAAPWLLCRADGDKDTRCYDVAEQQFHDDHVDFPVDKTCRGSAFGWLFMVQQTPPVFLLNPLTGNQIPLPPLTTFPHVLAYRPEKPGREYVLRYGSGKTYAHDKKYTEKKYIVRTAMSADPDGSSKEEELVVMAICFCSNFSLAFCKPGDAKWTPITHQAVIPFADVAFWKGKFYALDHNGGVYACDLSNPDHPELSLRDNELDLVVSDTRYLVISPDGDELMMVTRHMCVSPENDALFDSKYAAKYNDGEEEKEAVDVVVDEPDDDDGAATTSVVTYWTSKFRVFKLIADDDNWINDGRGWKGWDEVDSIGDFALFVGFNSPTFVSTEEHPELTANSIYFTDDVTYDCYPWWNEKRYAGHDMGIYDLTTGTIQPLSASIRNSPMPVWISSPE
ncbi:unnamed protein product [Linum trigynum]|uniref:KIB1-4 beta-propeller domain-containing protein n=1 Tax=Linum trigynum TaxID=586398 RepID=A0AAV2FIR0_9ROSI